MVLTGENQELNLIGSTGALPVTIMTAMVSPSDLPIPSMMAVTIQVRAAGIVIPHMVCQRVAPTAMDASR